MPYRSNNFTAGQYYHVYNRGAGRGRIFFDAGNYQYLIRLVGEKYRTHGVTVLAYCLMPNHYHFLLRQETDEPISSFISAVFNPYVQALNRQYKRSGALFEGRFKDRHVDKWEDLVSLCRYIHNNPVKAGLVVCPEDWAYSNYQEWVGMRESRLKDDHFIQGHFPKGEDYMSFVRNAQDEKASLAKIRKYVLD